MVERAGTAVVRPEIVGGGNAVDEDAQLVAPGNDVDERGAGWNTIFPVSLLILGLS